jgi:hypothetical protein
MFSFSNLLQAIRAQFLPHRQQEPSEQVGELVSSWLRSYKYDQETCVLTLTLKDEKVYEYENVPQWLVDKIANPENSPGTIVGAYLKSNHIYPCTQIS